MVDKDKPYWIAFNVFAGIGPLRFKLLLDYFGMAEKAWEASVQELLKIGLGQKLTEKFVKYRSVFDIKTYLKTLEEKKIQVLTLSDRRYPKLLREIPTAPPVLYVKGEIFPQDGQALAVVGTRKVTSYGRQVTQILTSDLVAQGFTIVSGMARGVDSIAHQAALKAGGRTIAVLGCGVDLVYPPENKGLYQQICQKGAVVSEVPVGKYVTRGVFPARNRIISGLSLGVLVTEGAKDSGSLITASFAGEQGREVFAVPGPITSPLSEAPATLIKKGAKLVYNVKDILEELNIKLKIKYQISKIIKGDTLEEETLLKLLQEENLHIDQIIRKTGWPSAKVGSILSLMEVKGKVKNFGGMVYGINQKSVISNQKSEIGNN